MANENEQYDEVIALQSIYEDGKFICNVSDKPITGNISINLETNAEEQNFTCNGDLMAIKHLTPLILNFSLPLNYPSVSPPDVTLSCLWLTSQQLEMLSIKLNDKWTESCNSVVLFTWIEFLKAEAFEVLGLQFPIDVSEDTIMKLTEHSVLREEEIFNGMFHFCPVCFLEKPGMHCVRMPFCDHIFCKECLSGFLSVYIQEGTMHSLVCPSKGCDEKVSPHIIKSLVSQSYFERYDRLLLQSTLDIMPDICYCPRIKCQKPVIADEDGRMGYCHACNFAFCTRCNMTYHGIDGCMWERHHVQESFRLALKEKKESPSLVADVSVTEPKYKRSGANQESRSERWIDSFTKPCPGCKINIQKNDGCNLMFCSRCCCKFCWNCLEMETRGPDGSFWPKNHGAHGCKRNIGRAAMNKIKNAKRKENSKQSKENLEGPETILVATDPSNGQSDVDQSILESKIDELAENSDLDKNTSDAMTIGLSTGGSGVGNITEKLGQEDQDIQAELSINSNPEKVLNAPLPLRRGFGVTG